MSEARVTVRPPVDPAGAAGRRARALVFAVVSVTLAAVAHDLGGQHRPRWWLLLFAVWAVQLAARPLAARERGLALLAVCVVGTQAALHVTFTVAMSGGPMAGMSGMSEPLRARALLPGGTLMLLAHLGAAVGVAAWLRLAERHVFATARRWAECTEDALLQLVHAVLGARLPQPVDVVRLSAVIRSEPVVPTPIRRIAAAVERRGPPHTRAA